jgi:2,4-dienoyl-CoA reductase-like NADH-dependent reductase (Old Yellow Enzyme family)
MEAVRVMKELGRMGVDAIEVSGGVASALENGPVRKGVRAGEGEAYFAPFAREVRGAVAPVPVIAVGGIRSFGVARDLLDSGAADMVALSRPLICEPGLPNRWLAGDRPPSACISCNRCFLAGLGGRGVACRNREARQ